jgi:hypothetical protein
MSKTSKRVHHAPDYEKNITADVIKHGDGETISSEQRESNRDITPKGADNSWGAFLPRPGKERPTPHTKTNECDH